MRQIRLIWILLIMVVCCTVTAVIVLQLVRQEGKKMAVVDAVRLFNEYKMKQELEARSDVYLKRLGARLDSMKQELTVLGKTPGVTAAATEALYRAAATARQELEQAFQESNRAINEQVWQRLNPLIDEYGRHKGLRLIVGANGMGSVLYHDAFYDHTAELVAFVNNRYETGSH